jgi:hypothetical protein
MAVGTAKAPSREAALLEEPVDQFEAIRLTLPHDERFLTVARIVVGGLAARLDLPYESLDDLQLGVESVLSEERYAVGGQVTIAIEIGNRLIRISIAPLDMEAIEADLRPSSDELGLNVLLPTVVDAVRFEHSNDGERWLVLEKQIPRAVES